MDAKGRLRRERERETKKGGECIESVEKGKQNGQTVGERKRKKRKRQRKYEREREREREREIDLLLLLASSRQNSAGRWLVVRSFHTFYDDN